VTAQHTVPKLLRDAPIAEPPLALPQAAESREIVDDYASLGRTLNRHPLALLRSRVPQQRFRTAAELAACRHGTLARACGASPPCGSGWARRAAPCSFLSKTKTGSINVIVWPSLVQKQREALLGLSSLGVYGVLQRDGGVATDGDLADSVGIQIGRPRGNGKTEAK
jgi:error-prone DNA polymerase